MPGPQTAPDQTLGERIAIRRAAAGDLERIAGLDARVTGQAKPDYWRDIFERYAARRLSERFFFVAQSTGASAGSGVLGYIVGEIRGWEFGSAPCGWVFAFAVEPDTRQQGIGEQLFQTLSSAFRDAGVEVMRTMVPRDNRLHMAFFRSEGMVAGPYIELEKDLRDDET